MGWCASRRSVRLLSSDRPREFNCQHLSLCPAIFLSPVGIDVHGLCFPAGSNSKRSKVLGASFRRIGNLVPDIDFRNPGASAEAAKLRIGSGRFWIAGYMPLLAGMRAGAIIFGGYTTRTAVRAAIFWLAFAALVLASVFIFTKPDAGSTLILVLACLLSSCRCAAYVLGIACSVWQVFRTAAGFAATHPLSACVLIYAFNLVVMLQQFTAPVHLWSGAVFSLSYLLFYLAGRRAALFHQAQGSVIR